MKIRKGFVSNSSSSSFIIHKSSYKSVFDLAKKMIPVREWDDDNELIKKIESAEIRGMSPNTSLCFNSCNYETYITLYKDYYLITTCNNHYWEGSLEGLINYYPDELLDLISGDCDPSDSDGCKFEYLEYNVTKLSSFWYVEYDIGGYPIVYPDPDYYDVRKNINCDHYKDIIRHVGYSEPICVACYKESQDKLVTKKLTSINKLSPDEKISNIEDIILDNSKPINKKEKTYLYKTLESLRKDIKND